MRRLLPALILLAACRPGRAYDPVVASLGGLSEKADAATFLRHPAMDELLSAMDDALPALERGLKSADGGIRARCLYVLQANHLVEAVPAAAALRGDPDPRVRVLLQSSQAQCAWDPPADLKAVAARTPWDPGNSSLHGLPPDLHARRIDRAFELIRRPRPVERMGEGLASGPIYGPLSSAGFYVLVRAKEAGQEVHGLLERALADLESIPAEDEGRLALVCDLLISLLPHREPDDGTRCPKGAEYASRAFAVVKARLPGAEHPALHDRGMHFLYVLAGVAGGGEPLALLRALPETQATDGGRRTAESWSKGWDRNRRGKP